MHIFDRKIINRKMIGLLHHQTLYGVSDDDVPDFDPQPLRRGHREDDIAGLERILFDGVKDGEMRPAAAQMELAHGHQFRLTRSSSKPAAMGTRPVTPLRTGTNRS